MRNPCYQCKNRVLHCHEGCSKYHEYKAVLQKASEEREKEHIRIGYMRDTWTKYWADVDKRELRRRKRW